MFNIGPQELLLILVVALIVVGPRRLPEIGRSIGKGLREIRKAQEEVRKTIQVNLEEEPPTRAAGATSVEAPSDGEPPKQDDAAGSGPAATAGAAAAPVAEISKTLGRGLAELRKTRREIQRTFRVDLSDPGPDRPSGATAPSRAAPAAAGTTRDEPSAAGSEGEAPAAEDPAGE